MRLALDTNLLVYAEGVNGPARQAAALHVVRLLPRRVTILPVQVLAELFNVLVRRRHFSRVEARQRILTWQDAFRTAETSLQIVVAAADLATVHQLSIWDAIVLAVAADSDCRLLLSEDLQEGFTWSGVTVVNPLAATWHPLLEVALGGPKPLADGVAVDE